MRSVCFALQKGGVGKTTISVTVAHEAARDRKVLLIDCDPQGSASSWLVTEAPQWELADVLQGKVPLADAVASVNDNLDVLPTFSVGGELRDYCDKQIEREPYVFADLRSEAERLGYALVVYDTSPTNGRLERSVMLGSDEVVPVLNGEYFAIDGMQLFRSFVGEIEKGFRTQVSTPRLVLNMLDKRYRRHGLYRDVVSKYGRELYEVYTDSRVGEAQLMHTPVPAESRVIEPLRSLAAAVAN